MTNESSNKDGLNQNFNHYILEIYYIMPLKSIHNLIKARSMHTFLL